MRYSRDKEVNKLIVKLIGEGWSFSRGRHGKLRMPDGTGFITISSTPSDYRCLLNIKRDIKRRLAGH